MTGHAIDSGTIGKVPFPGGGSGTGGITLLGTVSAAGVITATNRNVNIAPVGAAGASGTVSVPTVRSYLGAATTAQATNAVQERVKRGTAATTIAGAATSALIKMKLGPSAPTPAVAVTSAGAQSKVTRAGTSTPKATTAATATSRIPMIPLFAGGIATTLSGAVTKMRLSAATAATALPATILLRMKLSVPAAAQSAVATCSAAAVDYSGSVLAPTERTMYVPYYNRTMEVI